MEIISWLHIILMLGLYSSFLYHSTFFKGSKVTIVTSFMGPYLHQLQCHPQPSCSAIFVSIKQNPYSFIGFYWLFSTYVLVTCILHSDYIDVRIK